MVQCFYSDIYNRLRKIIEIDEMNGSSEINDVFSFNYLIALNELESYKKNQLGSIPLYLKCFKVFLKEFIINYNDQITEETLLILENLFKRIIHKKTY